MRSFALFRRFCPFARCATLTIVLAISLFIGLPADAQTTAKKALVGVLGVTPSNPANHEVQAFPGRTAAELDAALEAARRNGAGAVVVFSSPIVYNRLERIASLAREKRLPTVALFSEFAEVGGLLTYGPSLRESFRRCGVYVARILNGTKPADLPIERPEKFEFAINARTAKVLGLTIPDSLLRRADQIIE